MTAAACSSILSGTCFDCTKNQHGFTVKNSEKIMNVCRYFAECGLGTQTGQNRFVIQSHKIDKPARPQDVSAFARFSQRTCRFVRLGTAFSFFGISYDNSNAATPLKNVRASLCDFSKCDIIYEKHNLAGKTLSARFLLVLLSQSLCFICELRG